jgi:hypothetical protein
MAYNHSKSKFKPAGDKSSFDPIFTMDANASINNLFNGNSLFGPQAFYDSSLPPSIPL